MASPTKFVTSHACEAVNALDHPHLCNELVGVVIAHLRTLNTGVPIAPLLSILPNRD